jgi:hypothetical protein
MFGLFKKKINRYTYGPDKNGVTGVTLGWTLCNQLAFSGRVYSSKDLDYMLHKEYYPNGPDEWPICPETGEKLPIESYVRS